MHISYLPTENMLSLSFPFSILQLPSHHANIYFFPRLSNRFITGRFGNISIYGKKVILFLIIGMYSISNTLQVNFPIFLTLFLTFLQHIGESFTEVIDILKTFHRFLVFISRPFNFGIYSLTYNLVHPHIST